MASLEPQNGWLWNFKELYKGVGTKNGVTVSATESIAGKKTILKFTNTVIPITDTGGANGGQGSVKIYDFPEGYLVYLGGTTNLTIARVGTGLTTTAAVVASVGTVAAANTDYTLTGTEANLIPSTVATLTAGAGTVKGKRVSTDTVPLDGTTTAVDAYLNFAVPDAGISATDSLTVNGTVTLIWFNAGDN